MNLRDAAVANNAAWCAAVCAAHGIAGEWSPAAWTSPRRTPDLYPDAVTLTPRATAADLAGRIDAGPGCSVKDSYATLGVPGLSVLFEAQWIAAPAGPAGPPPPSLTWSRTDDVDEWAAAWMAANGERRHPFAGLIDAEFHAGRDATGRIIAGVNGFRSGPNRGAGEFANSANLAEALSATGDVMGASNVFGPPGHDAATWTGVRYTLSTAHPDLPLVGYEPGPALDHAIAAGFHATGPLRVLYIPA